MFKSEEMHRRLWSSAMVLAITTALAGCSTHSSGQGGDSSRAEFYSSLEEMANASELVVVGTAGSHTSEALDGVNFTLTDFSVKTVVRAPKSPLRKSSIVIRQTDFSQGAGEEDDGWAAPLIDGKSYVLYLKSNVINGVLQPDQYWLTGGQGAYVHESGNTYAATFKQAGISSRVTLRQDAGRATVTVG